MVSGQTTEMPTWHLVICYQGSQNTSDNLIYSYPPDNKSLSGKWTSPYNILGLWAKPLMYDLNSIAIRR